MLKVHVQEIPYLGKKLWELYHSRELRKKTQQKIAQKAIVGIAVFSYSVYMEFQVADL